MPIQKLLAEPPVKGDVATSPKDLQGSNTAEERKLNTPASSGELPAQTREEGTQSAEALAPVPSLQDSFGMVLPLWVPDPPGQPHELSQARGWAPWRAGRERKEIHYK